MDAEQEFRAWAAAYPEVECILNGEIIKRVPPPNAVWVVTEEGSHIDDFGITICRVFKTEAAAEDFAREAKRNSPMCYEVVETEIEPE